MKRKVYATPRERKTDQFMGFWAFPIVNVPLWLIYQMLYSRLPAEVAATGAASLGQVRILVTALPWLVNGIVLVLAFVFRPQLGVGYVTSAAIALIVVIALGALFLAACFLSLGTTAAVSWAITQVNGLVGRPTAANEWGASPELLMSLAIALFIALMLGGMYGLARLGRRLVRRWQSSGEDTPQVGDGNQSVSPP